MITHASFTKLLTSVQLRAVHPELSLVKSRRFLQIAPLTSALLSAAVELDQHSLGGLWSREAYQREIDSPNSDLLVLTIDHSKTSSSLNCPQEQLNGIPSILGLGCLWAILEEAHITTLAIHPDYQQQGLGKTLLHALLSSAQLRQLEWATLEVRASNHRAIALYQKFGFEPVGSRPNYYPDSEEDALILWRKGLQTEHFSHCLNHWREQIDQRLAQQGWQLS